MHISHIITPITLHVGMNVSIHVNVPQNISIFHTLSPTLPTPLPYCLIFERLRIKVVNLFRHIQNIFNTKKLENIN